MTKIEQFDVALRIAGFNFKKPAVEVILKVKELLDEKEGEATIDDITNIVSKIEAVYEEKT